MSTCLLNLLLITFNSIMLTGAIKKIKGIPSYFYRNFAAPRIYSLRDRKILLKNIELKNKYSGQHCFIIGGGPSVANIDLPKLSQEYTFVTNEFDKNPKYQALAPKFHLMSDSQYYTEDTGSFWLKRFKEKDQNISKETTVLLNLASRPFIKKYGLFKNHSVFYIGTQGIMSDNFPFSIKLDRYVPMPKNSLLLCLISAYYMGFSPIYILGCEHDFLAYPLKPGEPNTNNWYPYSYVDKEIANLDLSNAQVAIKFASERDAFANYECAMAHVLQLYKNYRLFYKKAKQANPDFQVLNVTPNSFLDVFPHIDFDQIKL